MGDDPVFDAADDSWSTGVASFEWDADSEPGDYAKVTWATVRWTAEGFAIEPDGEDPGC